MGVRAEEERAVRALSGAVLADRLGGRSDVVVVERGGKRRAAVPGRAEGDGLGGVRRIGCRSW